MYIRRKVFSSDDDEKSGKGKKAAIIGGAAVAPVAVAGGYQLVRGRKRAEKNWKKLSEKVNEAGGLENMGAEAEKINNQMLKASARKRSNKVDKFGDDGTCTGKNTYTTWYAFERIYSTIDKRFNSKDPVVGTIYEPERVNSYIYAGDNPLSHLASPPCSR